MTLCDQSIIARVKLSRDSGRGTKFAHYNKLISDYDKLPIEFKKTVDDIKKEYESALYEPANYLMLPYKLFWEIRMTKAIETPITHGDILSAITLYGWKLSYEEVKVILHWDRVYYSVEKENT